MHYYYAYSICALLFLLLIAARFFSMRRFPNAQNRTFAVILWLALLDLALSIAAALAFENAAALPLWIPYAAETLYYMLQTAFPSVFVIYVLVLRDGALRNKRPLYLVLVPLALAEALILANPFTHMFYRISVEDGAGRLVREPPYLAVLFFGVLNLCAALFLTLKYRRTLQEKQMRAILGFFGIVALALAVQVFFPQYPLTGVALTAAILMIFFTLQNPEDQLDLISGMFNYTAMTAYLSLQLERDRQLWLVAVDIGGIRRVNSALGVSVGNAVFAEIGRFFNGLGGGVWPFRMISTRFLIVAPSDEEYRRVIDAVEERFQSPWLVRGNSLSLSVTIRYFSEWNFFKSPEDVVNLIDVAYSEIGAEGWGVKKRISTELLLRIKRRLTVENAIREALKTGQGFSLRFQPIYEPAAGRYPCVEVLLRLHSPELGELQPAEFIPIAERSGTILQIDELVIARVCEFYNRNERDLRGVLTRLHVNLSAAEFFKNPGLRIHWLVCERRVAPELICFEVTETAASAHPGILAGFMRDMRSRGYSFALDDYGTGYSNASRVVDLPFEIVKLDRSLLLPEDEKSLLLFSGFLEMFSKIGVSSVVEGVETEEQAKRASALGADLIQGFYYARPMTEQAYLDFLRAPPHPEL